MHSLRRIALRSAASALRASAPKARQTPFRSWTAPSPTALVACSRSFSQAARVANTENSPSEATTSEAAATEAAAGHETSNPSEQQSEVASDSASSSSNAAAGQSELGDGETPHGLFVRNIVFDATEDHLVEIFEKYGEVVNTVIVRDPRGLSRGYGFVYFNNAESMNKAAANVHGSFWHGRRLMVNPRVKGGERKTRQRKETGPTNCLYVGNIPYETTDAELNRLFRDLDNIRDVRVAVDRVTGWPRGFAHADFADVASAEKAHQRLQGAMLGSRELSVDFAQSSAGRSPRRE